MTDAFPSPIWKVPYASLAIGFAYPMTEYIEDGCYVLAGVCIVLLIFLGMPLKILPISVVTRMWIAVFPSLFFLALIVFDRYSSLCGLVGI